MALRWVLHTTSLVLGFPCEHNNHSNVGDPNGQQSNDGTKAIKCLKVEPHPSDGFRMPLHYPRYKRGDYENMEEWRVDLLLREYGLSYKGSLEEKRAFAIGAFLWPDQL